MAGNIKISNLFSLQIPVINKYRKKYLSVNKQNWETKSNMQAQHE